jgi:trimethylamine--corrinoid protein Co-methyltransferase
VIVFCDEVIAWVRRFLEPKEAITADNLALDVIDRVGPEGNYLMDDHTLDHIRDDWLPVLTDRQIFEKWAAAGGTTMEQRVRERLLGILEQDVSAVVPDDVAARVRAIARGTQ